jgi:hypothetical protein
VPVPCLCYFCILEKIHRKYYQNWIKQKPKFLFSLKRHGVQSRDGWVPEGGRTTPWRGPPLAAPRPGVGLWATSWRRPSAYIFPSTGKPKRPDQFSTKHTASRRHRRCEIRRVQKLFPIPCRRVESPPEDKTTNLCSRTFVLFTLRTLLKAIICCLQLNTQWLLEWHPEVDY